MRAGTLFAVGLAAAAIGLSWAAEQCCSEDQRATPDKRGFSAWGGKRSGGDQWLPPEEAGDDQKRAFSSWGGKRARGDSGAPDGASEDKPPTWDDKLDDLKHLLPPIMAADNLVLEDILEDKRGGARFSSWGGKRGSVEDDGDGGEEDQTDSKRAFSSWGGKRHDESLVPKGDSEDRESGDKRAFSSWGGKRAFSSWGGKRAFSSWGGKRSLEPGKWRQKAFSSWGGKRAQEGERVRRSPADWSDSPLFFLFKSWLPERGNSPASFYDNNVPARRGAGPPFFPWGG